MSRPSPARRPVAAGRAPDVAEAPVGVRPAELRGRHAPGRTAFVALVLAMLGGGLVCLLMINTTLAASSFQITNLQQQNASLAQREQALAQQLAAQEAPAVLARRAASLGLRPEQVLNFLNVRTGRISTQPRTLPGVPAVPGYTP